MIEEYLNKYTYDWKFHAEFIEKGRRYLTVSEWSPGGELGKPYMLYEKRGKIYNEQDEVVYENGEATE